MYVNVPAPWSICAIYCIILYRYYAHCHYQNASMIMMNIVTIIIIIVEVRLVNNDNDDNNNNNRYIDR